MLSQQRLIGSFGMPFIYSETGAYLKQVQYVVHTHDASYPTKLAFIWNFLHLASIKKK